MYLMTVIYDWNVLTSSKTSSRNSSFNSFNVSICTSKSEIILESKLVLINYLKYNNILPLSNSSDIPTLAIISDNFLHYKIQTEII